MRRVSSAFVAVAMAGLALVGCGSDGDGGDDEAAGAATATITVSDDGLELPASVGAGAVTLNVVNEADTAYSVGIAKITDADRGLDDVRDLLAGEDLPPDWLEIAGFMGPVEAGGTMDDYVVQTDAKGTWVVFAEADVEASEVEGGEEEVEGSVDAGAGEEAPASPSGTQKTTTTSGRAATSTSAPRVTTTTVRPTTTTVAGETSRAFQGDDEETGTSTPDAGEEPPSFVEVLEVKGSSGEALPTGDVTIEGVDFGYNIEGDIEPGPQRVRISNPGEQDHIFVMIKLDGVDLDDALEGEGPPPEGVEFLRDLGYLDPGYKAVTTFEFEKGDYGLVCFLPDTSKGKDGKPHYLLGMKKQFTVE